MASKVMPGDVVIDVFDQAFQRDPCPVFAEARQRGRTARDTFGSIILLYIEDFDDVAADKRFGACRDRLPRMLGAMSGPAYDWLANCTPLEARVALQQFLTRLPGLRLAREPSFPADYVSTVQVQDVKRLDLAWTPRDAC